MIIIYIRQCVYLYMYSAVCPNVAFQRFFHSADFVVEEFHDFSILAIKKYQ